MSSAFWRGHLVPDPARHPVDHSPAQSASPGGRRDLHPCARAAPAADRPTQVLVRRGTSLRMRLQPKPLKRTDRRAFEVTRRDLGANNTLPQPSRRRDSSPFDGVVACSGELRVARPSRLLAVSDALAGQIAQRFDERSHPSPRCTRARRAGPDPHPGSVVAVTGGDRFASVRGEKHVVAARRGAGRSFGVSCEAHARAVASVGPVRGLIRGRLTVSL
jgi:hypothetical protein